MKPRNTLYAVFIATSLIINLFLPSLSLADASFDELYAPSNLVILETTQSSVNLHWESNSRTHEGFDVYRASYGTNDWLPVGTTGPNTTVFTDSGLISGYKYKYEVCAFTYAIASTFYKNYSNPSNVVTASLPGISPAPNNFAASVLTNNQVKLSWTPTGTETGFIVQRMDYLQNWHDIWSGNAASFCDTISTFGSYTYRIQSVNAYGQSNWSTASVNISGSTLPNTKPGSDTTTSPGRILIQFPLNSSTYYIDEAPAKMDVKPVIIEDRAYLPIRYIANPLGAQVEYNTQRQEITINLKSQTIKLWIGQNKALVKGKKVMIDSNNSSVKPFTVPPGRTMLPMRFIAENLGCSVYLAPRTNRIIVQYPNL